MRWFVVLLCAWLMQSPAGSGQPVELESNPDYQAGLNALRDQLPDLAVARFAKAREGLREDPVAARRLDLVLAEAHVRAARAQRDPSQTLRHANLATELLSPPEIQELEKGRFWSGHAHLLAGRVSPALVAFESLAEAADPSLRTPAQLVRAHLLASLSREEEAHSLLESMIRQGDEPVAAEASLLRASLLLEAGQLEELAGHFQQEPDPADPLLRLQRRYLQARLAQEQGEHARAAELFRPLAENPGTLAPSIHHGAIVGLAEALHATSKDNKEQLEEAVDTLLGLVDRHPKSPLLEAAMVRLLEWTGSDESLENRLMDRLRDWANVPVTIVPSRDPSNSPGPDAEPKAVLPAVESERAGYALYYYSLHLAGRNEPESNKLAATLLEFLRTHYPAHPLAAASLLETARLQSAADDRAAAVNTLRRLAAEAGSTRLKTEAADLIALLEFKSGEFSEAAQAFARARVLLAPRLAAARSVNEGISLLRAGDFEAFAELVDSLPRSEVQASLLLEQALVQVSQETGDSRTVLENFLQENPDHPRTPEAQIAYAAELLRLDPASPSSLNEARARLGGVAPSTLNDQAALRHLLSLLRLAQLTDKPADWNFAIERGRVFLETRDAGALTPSLRLKLAEAYFMNGNLAKARIEFENLADQQPEGLLHEVALLFAAKAALKLRTEKSPAEAMALLRRVIEAEGVTANEARLLLARSQIDNTPSEALSTLQPLLDATGGDPNQLQALALAAEAHRALGTPEHYREAIKLYDRVLSRQSLSYPLSNRFHSLLGQAYELLGENEEALQTYYRVLNYENLPAAQEPTEWDWYTECGFKAVRLLEQQKRWKPALLLLRKLGESGSPRAGEARERFRNLQLEQQVWKLDE